jgi:hypothetical protein
VILYGECFIPCSRYFVGELGRVSVVLRSDVSLDSGAAKAGCSHIFPESDLGFLFRYPARDCMV